MALECFVAERLPAALPRQRWFGSQGRRIVAVRLRDLAPLGPRAPGAWWSLVDVEFERGPDETYALPTEDAVTIAGDISFTATRIWGAPQCEQKGTPSSTGCAHL